MNDLRDEMIENTMENENCDRATAEKYVDEMLAENDASAAAKTVKAAKSEKVEGVGEVVRRGHSVVGCVAWETPYIIIKDKSGKTYRYQSDRVDQNGLSHLKSGDQVQFNLLVRGDKVWRVKEISKIAA